MTSLKKNDYLIICSFLTLLVYIILFLSRRLDDNRLTSWLWAFRFVNPAHIFYILIFCIIAAFMVNRFSLPRGTSSLFLFLISFGAAGSMWTEPEVIVDASRYFTQAKYLELNGMLFFLREWGRSIHAWTDLPVIPFLYGVIFRYFGESRLFIQIFVTALFSLSVVFTYLIGKELWDEDTGFWGALLLLGMPYLLIQVPLMLVDVPAMFFLTCSIFIFIIALRYGGLMLIFLSAVVIALTFFSKYSMWLMLSILPAIFFVHIIQPRNCSIRHYIYRGASIALFAALLIGFVVICRFDVFSEQINILITYQKPGLERWGESFVSTFFFQIHPFITVAALFSLFKAVMKRDITYLIIAWLLVLVLVLQIRRIRYIIMVFPMLALMASYGLTIVADGRVRKYIVSCTVISSAVIGVFAYLPFLKQINMVNLQEAGIYLNTLQGTHIDVFTVSPSDAVGDLTVAVPLLDLYTDKNISYNRNKDEIDLELEKIRKSSLRFTWEYNPPEFYRAKEMTEGKAAAVVISYDAEQELPENVKQGLRGYSLVKVFNKYEGIFRFRTSVRVYE